MADKIQTDVEALLDKPGVKRRYATVGYEPLPVTREDFNALINTEPTKYAAVVKRVKASLD